jgi:hypothetical protein
VSENGVKLCSPTPCEATFPSAPPEARHELTIVRPGFKPATLEVVASDNEVKAKLEPSAVPKAAGAPVDKLKDYKPSPY